MLLGWSGNTMADDYLKKITAGPWSGGSIDNSGNGKADFCQLGAENDAGFNILMIWAQPGLIMAIIDRDMHLKKGKYYPAEISIDPVWQGNSRFKATSSTALTLAVFNNKKIIRALKQGSKMTIIANGAGRWRTPLRGSSKAISTLKSCYRTEVEGKPLLVAKKALRPATKPTSRPKAPVARPMGILLMPEKHNFAPGQKITLAFSGFPARGQDWIALSSVSHKADQYFDMVMLEGRPHSGSHSFNGLPAGNYELRAYTNWPDGGYKIATKASISVAKASAMPKAPIPLTSLDNPVSPAQSSVSIKDANSISETEPVDDLEDEPEEEAPIETSMDMAQQAPLKDKAPAGVKRPRTVISNPDLAQIPVSIQIPQDQLPPVIAPDAPRGLGVEIPAIDSWPYYDFGGKGVDEVSSLLNLPKNLCQVGHHKNWQCEDQGKSKFTITQYSDDNKHAKKLVMVFGSKGLGNVIKLTKDGNKNLLITFNSYEKRQVQQVSYRKIIEGRMFGVPDGLTYTYRKGIAESIKEMRPKKEGAHMSHQSHGKEISVDLNNTSPNLNGFRKDHGVYDNGRRTGTWKFYRDGKLTLIENYDHGKLNGIKVRYKNGIIISVSGYRNNENYYQIEYRNGKLHSWKSKENGKWPDAYTYMK